MHKTLCILLCLCLILLCSCSAANTPQIPTVRHTQTATPTAEAPAVFTRGSLQSGVYASEFAGIHLALPDGWTYADAKELEALTEYDADGALRSVTDLIAQNMQTGDNVTILYDAAEDVTEEEYAASVSALLLQDEIYRFTVHDPEPAALGGKEYLCLRCSVEDYDLEQLYLLHRRQSMMTVVILTGEDPDSLLSYFS